MVQVIGWVPSRLCESTYIYIYIGVPIMRVQRRSLHSL